MFVVLATDDEDNWRCKDVKAFDHEDAAEEYNLTMPYKVRGVGLLGGSGHPVNWLGGKP